MLKVVISVICVRNNGCEALYFSRDKWSSIGKTKTARIFSRDYNHNKPCHTYDHVLFTLMLIYVLNECIILELNISC